jgi:ABC-type antimicrobial peptide transport system permease subunit
VFATPAIATSAAGLFSVLSYAVGRRRREFGIRTALGASPRQIRRLVVREGLVIAAVGVAVGAVAGSFLARLFQSLHYGVTAADPVSWLTVLIAVSLTAAAASWRPASQAMRSDPLQLLRAE